MIYEFIRWSLCAIMEAIGAVTTARILTMRSNAVFYVLRALVFIINVLYRDQLHAVFALNLAMVLIAEFCLPILLSTDHLRTRIMRTALLVFGKTLTEIIGATSYSFLTGTMTAPDNVGPDNITHVVFVYLVLIMITVVVFGAVVILCAHLDGRDSSPFEAPTAALMLGSLFPLALFYTRLVSISRTLLHGLPALAYCWLSLAGIYLTFRVASREAESQREAAELAVATRRERHARAEADALSRRAEGMGSLRHALANEARTVRRLAESGHTEEAGRRLAGLQEQAHVLNGGAAE